MIEKLLAILEKQETNLNQLLQSVFEKQVALVNNNNEGIKELVSKEEKLLLTIQLNEEMRLKAMEEIFSHYKIQNERYKLSILIANLNGKVHEKIIHNISLMERRIKKIIKEIQKVNQQNMLLIQQSRSLINDTITAVLNLNNRTIVDRKA
jgi:hypothetical protein